MRRYFPLPKRGAQLPRVVATKTTAAFTSGTTCAANRDGFMAQAYPNYFAGEGLPFWKIRVHLRQRSRAT